MFRKSGHISFALLLLVSTTGLTINFHFCDNRIYDIAFFGKADACCCMTGKDQDEHSKDLDYCDDVDHQENNCNDESIRIIHPDDFIISSIDFFTDSNPVQKYLNALPVPGYAMQGRETKFYFTDRHKPPPLNKNPYCLFQNFLL